MTFATHDLRHLPPDLRQDLFVKRLGPDPGESDDDRAAAKEARSRNGVARASNDRIFVSSEVSATRRHGCLPTMEDALGLVDQVITGNHQSTQLRGVYPSLSKIFFDRSSLTSIANLMTAKRRIDNSGP